jgi:hypothetical protein
MRDDGCSISGVSGTASTSANADQNPRGQPKIVVERIVDGSHVIAGHTGLLGIGTYR